MVLQAAFITLTDAAAAAAVAVIAAVAAALK